MSIGVSWRHAVLGVVALSSACAGEPDGRQCTDVDGDHSGTFGPESPPVESPAIFLSPTRALAAQAANHLVHYGGWNDEAIAIAQQHDLVILDPDDDITREQVAAIQEGGDHRVIVACYISIGEDHRTAALDDDELEADPRFAGDGTGPRVDPRGPDADGQSLGGIAPLGAASPGGNGFASWYLDDVTVDGLPDRNGNFGGAFVNAGDPAWFAALQDMTLDGTDGIAGLREILTTTTGRGLGCDGVFLDTIDTAAPNDWTDEDSSNPTEYEWTAPGLSAFLVRLRAAYPDVVIVQNRGLFFFNPFNPQFQFIPRGQLDFVTYESYRLNSDATDNPHPYHYPNNRFNYAPKLMAEANRIDGFRVLSIGYAEGPADQMSEATLVGESTLGLDSLLEDIHVTEQLAGFRHYLSNSSLTLLNTFVADHADREDDQPPAWTSSWNDHNSVPPNAPGEPTPRVGIQQVVPGEGSLTVRWDVAQDLNRVRYALYYRTEPFDFECDPDLTMATRVVLSPRPPSTYSHGVGPGIFANEATLTGLTVGQTYHLVIRAFDDSPAANEDDNQVVLTGVPAGPPAYLGRWRASNGTSSLTYRFQYSESWNFRHVWIDRDRVAGTGFSYAGIGADLLLKEGRLYRYTGNGTSWSWAFVKSVALTGGPIDGMWYVRWDLAQADLGAPTQQTQVVFQVQRPGASVASATYQHVYTTTDPTSPILGMYAENDAARIFFHAEIGPAYSWRHVFLDDDANPATGYAFGGVGAGYMIENNSLYRHVGPGWAWLRIGSANQIVAAASHDWSIARADVGAGSRFDVVFQANGGPPSHVAPVYAFALSP